ncbi:MAG TPA: poly-beta-1,6-N-acetyl-D-glucosamine biosynthesis protein PgaD [Gammaproteobacteria bacterium]|jgi:biofilm PGA synthesis protein PgaD
MAVVEKEIIQAPELLTARERARDTVVTAAMWALYLYLWVPLISLFAWVLGFELAYDIMIRSGGAQDLGSILLFYGVIIGVIFCVVTAWSLINRVRYRRQNRRHLGRSVADEAIAAFFGVDPATLPALRQARRVRLDFDAAGRPVAIDD